MKLTTRYTHHSWRHANGGICTVLKHSENGREEQFFIADPQTRLEGVISHMDSLTDELCDFWLDPERQELAKAAAKTLAKEQRDRNMAQAAQERLDKTKKKQENRDKQAELRKEREALQGQQTTDNH